MDVAGRVVLGMAVGDAIGLPWENLAPRSVREDRLGRTFLGRGVVSDDTEHAYLTWRAWAEAEGDLERFRRALASRLRWWFLALPPGIGFGTARSMMKLCLGWSPERSGSTSAGNGPAMRAVVLGVLVPAASLRDWVDASSLITHRDPRALEGAWVVAALARAASDGVRPTEALRGVVGQVQGGMLRQRLDQVLEGASTRALVDAWVLEQGVTGFIDDTVPVAVQLWLRHDDVSEGVRAAVRLGGDTDTVAAIVGGLLAASGSAPSGPDVQGLRDWPLSAGVLTKGARELGWAGSLLRNLLLLPAILGHLLTRRFL